MTSTGTKAPRPSKSPPKWRYLGGLLSLILLAATVVVSVQPPPAEATTADHFVRTIYLVPKDAPRQNRADVMMTTMRAVQRDWATWGWTFELEPEPKVINSEKTCAEFTRPSAVPNEVVNYYPLHEPGIVTVIFAECAGGGVGISWGDFAVIYEHIVRRLDKGGTLEKSMIGAVSHELGHSFGLGHVQCSPTEWSHTGPMCAGGFAQSDPSPEQAQAVFKRRCGWIQECSGGPKRKFTREDDKLLDTKLYVDAGLTSTSAGGSDFNGDGKDDIFWYGPSSAPDTFWNGTSSRGRFSPTDTAVNGADYTPITGNFGGGETDAVILYHPRTGDAAFSNGPDSNGNVKWERASLGVAPGRPSVGDFNGDGHDDILWYQSGIENHAIWYGTDERLTFNRHDLNVPGTYLPVIGDYDGDGFDDILWSSVGASSSPLWSGTATETQFEESTVSVTATDQPLAGDFNGDGFDDIFFYGVANIRDGVLYGTEERGTFTQARVNVGGTYRPVVGDFDGDGFDDIYWYTGKERRDGLWFGTTKLGGFRASYARATSLGISIPAS